MFCPDMAQLGVTGSGLHTQPLEVCSKGVHGPQRAGSHRKPCTLGTEDVLMKTKGRARNTQDEEAITRGAHCPEIMLCFRDKLGKDAKEEPGCTQREAIQMENMVLMWGSSQVNVGFVSG